MGWYQRRVHGGAPTNSRFQDILHAESSWDSMQLVITVGSNCGDVGPQKLWASLLQWLFIRHSLLLSSIFGLHEDHNIGTIKSNTFIKDVLQTCHILHVPGPSLGAQAAVQIGPSPSLQPYWHRNILRRS